MSSPTSGPDTFKRRSQRVFVQIPIEIVGQTLDGVPFREKTHSLTVNAHGGLVDLGVAVEMGQGLQLVHTATGEAQQSHVVYVGSEENGRRRVGVEFDKPVATFWRVEFPPDDWQPFT